MSEKLNLRFKNRAVNIFFSYRKGKISKKDAIKNINDLRKQYPILMGVYDEALKRIEQL